MIHVENDRNLLIGVLALHLDLITQDQMVAAMSAWVLQSTQSLDEILEDHGALKAGTRELLVSLAELHVEQHDGDPGRSLDALCSRQQVSVATEWRSLIHRSTGDGVDWSASSSGAAATKRKGLDQDAFCRCGARYKVLRPYAKGGLGQISVALDQELNREVAVKEIQSQFADNPESRSRFMLEAEVTSNLEHPGIVPVYGFGTHADGRPYYAMRLVRGQSLREAIQQLHKDKPNGLTKTDYEGLAFRKLLGRFVDVCNAMEYAHGKGVLHRDLKPSNIMLGRYGETLIVDWGLSKIVAHGAESNEDPAKPSTRVGACSSATLLGSTVGTPAYMAPEQAAGRSEEIGAVSDVYGLGATLYCLLTNRSPFFGKEEASWQRNVRLGNCLTPQAVNPKIPKHLEAICLKAMATDINERYPNVSKLADDIEHYLADRPIAALTDNWPSQVLRWSRKHAHQAIAAVIAIFICTVVGVILILAVSLDSDRKLAFAQVRYRQAVGKLTDYHLDAIFLADSRARFVTDGSANEAKLEFKSLVDLQSRYLDDDDQKRILGLRTLAQLHLDDGEYSKAEPLLSRALNVAREHYQEDHSEIKGLLLTPAQGLTLSLLAA